MTIRMRIGLALMAALAFVAAPVVAVYRLCTESIADAWAFVVKEARELFSPTPFIADGGGGLYLDGRGLELPRFMQRSIEHERDYTHRSSKRNC